MVIVFANHLKSVSSFEFDTNPLERTLKKEFYTPKRFKQQGDGTVTTTSAILPGFKWMYDFLHPQSGAEKPIHIAHYCGSYNVSESTLEHYGVNSFYGIECDCKRRDGEDAIDGNRCNHDGMMNDVSFAKFVKNSLFSEEEGRVGERFEQMSEGELDDWWKQCRLLNQD